jgi:hypothetical protein
VSDEVVEIAEPKDERGLSRRNALKAGVAVGVGVAAWSGASITSLGGTPAYAQGCTAVTLLNLSGKCRNTDQASNCNTGVPFRYHTLNSVSLPFILENNPPEGTCCDTPTGEPILHWLTSNLTCVAHTEVWAGLQACKDRGPGLPEFQGTFVGTISGTGSGSGVHIPMGCGTAAPNSFYTIFALCGSTGSPPGCFSGGP